MTGQIDIVNRALMKLGQNPIQALTENTKSARLAQQSYDLIRQSELRKNFWNFSIKRAVLPLVLNSTTGLPAQDAFNQSYIYNLPTDCLRINQVDDIYTGVDLSEYRNTDTREFTVEGRQILWSLNNGGALVDTPTVTTPGSSTPPTSLNLRYVADVTDPNLFDHNFSEALSCKLAMEWCEALTQSAPKRSLAQQEYTQAIRDARNSDATENPSQSLPDNTWIISRVN